MVGNKKTLVVLASAFLVVVSAMVMFSGNAKAWNVTVNLTPDSITAGTTVDFSVTITNTGSEAMRITYIGLHFDWLGPDEYYYIKDISDSNPVIIESGNGAHFTMSISIPSNITTDTYHSVIVTIDASDPVQGGWGDVYSQSTPEKSIYVAASGSGGGSDNNTSDNNNGICLIGWVAITALLANLAVMYFRKQH